MLRLRQNAFHLRKQQQKRNLLIEFDIMEIIFWLMYEGEKLIAFVDGFVTDEPDLTDEMYEDAAMHNENGAWQMIFGINTLPDYRRQGYAGELICRAIEDARMQGRNGLVLTCKEKLISYYAKYGFVDEGVSDKSTHGNVQWHQMRLCLN